MACAVKIQEESWQVKWVKMQWLLGYAMKISLGGQLWWKVEEAIFLKEKKTQNCIESK